MDDYALTPMEADALREIGNIGTGNAATALSQLVNKKVDLIIPNTKIVPIKEFTNQIGNPEEVVICTYLQVIGDIKGESLFLFPKADAMNMIDLMLSNPPGTTKIIDDMGESTLKEMSNIFEGSYLNSIANFFSIKLLPSIPHITTDMMQSVIDFVLANISNYASDILSIKTEIVIAEEKIKGVFVLLFDKESLQKILNLLKTMYG